MEDLSRTVLFAAFSESDPGVRGAMWEPLLMYLRSECLPGGRKELSYVMWMLIAPCFSFLLISGEGRLGPCVDGPRES